MMCCSHTGASHHYKCPVKFVLHELKSISTHEETRPCNKFLLHFLVCVHVAFFPLTHAPAATCHPCLSGTFNNFVLNQTEFLWLKGFIESLTKLKNRAGFSPKCLAMLPTLACVASVEKGGGGRRRERGKKEGKWGIPSPFRIFPLPPSPLFTPIPTHKIAN